MVRSENGEVYMNGSGIQVVTDIGCAISALYDSCFEHGMSLISAKKLIDSMVTAAFDECKYNETSDNIDDELT